MLSIRFNFTLILFKSLLVLLFTSAHVTAFDENKLKIKKGDIDDRVYQYHVLDNKLKVLLISDAKADKAAAALSVNVGSYHDPVDREGLAHFLEHMLFLGTKKYPEADEYQAYISDNGGSHNAYTSSHETNYFFDVDNSQFEPALDRFAQFFIAPLFDEFYVDRERNAVHSEYQSRIQDDFRRGYDVYRSVINPAHPEAKFNVGSSTTLADRPDDKVRDDLLQFYEEHYSSDKMSLIVLGNYPINTLKKMVESRFSQIPKKDGKSVQNPNTKQPLFLDGQLPLEVLSRPIKELRQMSMNFPVPSIKEFYKEKPLDFIAHIIGHEGKGSLLSLLKQRGLAESLSAGGRDKNDGTGAFYISVQLTQKGVEEREQVRALIFYVIEQIKNRGVEQWRYEEKQLLSQIAFRFRENASAISTVRGLASNLHQYPAVDVINGDYLLERYDAELIKQFLTFLSPANVYVTSTFPEAETDQRSQYYQTPYRVQKLSADILEQQKNAVSQSVTKVFSLPEANPFIPANLELFATDASLDKPVRLNDIQSEEVNKQLSDIWVKQDTSFATPRVKVQFRLLSPLIAGDLKGTAKAELYAQLLQDRLNEFSYPALLAGAAIVVDANNRGIDITVQGFHDRLYKLMEVLIAEIERATFESQRFDQLKTDTLRRWRNNEKKTPYHQLYNQLAVDLYTPYWSDKAKINALTDVSLSELHEFAKNWRKGAQIKGLFYGNLSQVWIKDWEPLLDGIVLGDGTLVPPVKVAKLQRADSKLAQYDFRVVDHSDKAVMLYVQGSDDSLETQAAMVVLRQLLQSPFYSSLRTEQQLGYIVFLGSLQLKEVPGSVFVVQSPSASLEKMRTAIKTFISDYEAKLPDDITVYQQAVITQLLEAPTSLSVSANDYWSNILRGNMQFDRRQMLAEAVKALTSEQLKQAYQNSVLDVSKTIWVFSKEPKGEDMGNERRYTPSTTFYSYP
ncbi:MAG: insulinase family protein [Cellvibrionaceae bacterium]